MVQTAKVKITADTKQAKQSFKVLGKEINITTAAITAAGTAIIGLITSSAKLGDQFDKMSKRTGIAVETLSTLGFAAEQAGSNVIELETGLKRLARNISDANEGLTTSIRAFDRLGVAIKDDEGNLREIEDILPEVADAMNQLGTDTERTATAQELFGRAGTQLLPLLKEGASGIKALQQEARDYNIEISTETASASAEFTDAINKMTKSLQGLAAEGLTPVIADLAVMFNKFSDLIAKFNEIRQSKVGKLLFGEGRKPGKELTAEDSRFLDVLGITPGELGTPGGRVGRVDTSVGRATPGRTPFQLFPERAETQGFMRSSQQRIPELLGKVKFEDVEIAVSDMDEALKSLGMTFETEAVQVNQFQRDLSLTFRQTFDDILEGQLDFGKSLRGVFNNIFNAILDDLSGRAGKKLGGFFGDLLGEIPGIGAIFKSVDSG